MCCSYTKILIHKLNEVAAGCTGDIVGGGCLPAVDVGILFVIELKISDKPLVF
jgi:hypothetical protein